MRLKHQTPNLGLSILRTQLSRQEYQRTRGASMQGCLRCGTLRTTYTGSLDEHSIDSMFFIKFALHAPSDGGNHRSIIRTHLPAPFEPRLRRPHLEGNSSSTACKVWSDSTGNVVYAQVHHPDAFGGGCHRSFCKHILQDEEGATRSAQKRGNSFVSLGGPRHVCPPVVQHALPVRRG
ncbi:hypothetical protein BC827DRAFT_916494 [Russula dissimulans]|nr:hypothetical protein BC827DRAFT_916494 [Russula dissimulans]